MQKMKRVKVQYNKSMMFRLEKDFKQKNYHNNSTVLNKPKCSLTTVAIKIRLLQQIRRVSSGGIKILMKTSVSVWQVKGVWLRLQPKNVTPSA